MSFEWPVVLLVALVAVPLLARAVARGLRRRRVELAEFGEPAVLAHGSSLPDERRVARRAWLQLAAVAFGLLALARPQLGEQEADLARTGRDVLVAFDLSRSMTVGDVSPDRLAEAKRATWEMVSAFPGDRVGLLVFGGSAFLQLPLTSDHAAFKLFLDAATPDDLGDPSTDIGNALATAAKVFEHEGEHGHRAVLLVTDGEIDETTDLEKATEGLRGEGIPVFALGVGTTRGGPVPADSSEAPEKWHRDYIGRIATSRLDEASLRKTAALTGGAYARADRPDDVRALRTALARVRTRTLASEQTRERADRFQWPLALAAVALLADLALAAGARRRMAVRRRIPVGARAAAAVVLLFLAGGCTRGALDARKGERLYDAGEFAESARLLDQSLAADSTPERAYAAGNAYYRLKRYEIAAARYRDAAGSAKLRQRSVFNLGNALVRAAEETPERGQLLLDAVAAYEEALRLEPSDRDAKWNLEIAVQRLEDDRMAGGSSGRGRNGDYGRGNMNVPGYEGNPDNSSGAMAGGGYGSAEGESVQELDADEARQLLEAVQREQLATHEGRPSHSGPSRIRDW